MRRFFVATLKEEDKQIVIEGTEGRHIARVLRMQPGDRCELFNGRGLLALSEIVSVHKDSVFLQVIKMSTAWQSAAELSSFPLTLAQGVLKGKKMDLIVEKATELGVEHFIPIITDYSQNQTDMNRRRQRWQRIVLSSCKQCGRTTPMTIASPLELGDIDLTFFTHKIFCSEKKDQNRKLLSPDFFTDKGKVLLIVGPEGGFSEAEVSFARDNNFFLADLGPIIMRAETASISICAITTHLCRLKEDDKGGDHAGCTAKGNKGRG